MTLAANCNGDSIPLEPYMGLLDLIKRLSKNPNKPHKSVILEVQHQVTLLERTLGADLSGGYLILQKREILKTCKSLLLSLIDQETENPILKVLDGGMR